MSLNKFQKNFSNEKADSYSNFNGFSLTDDLLILTKMMSNDMEDYEVLSILGKNTSSSCYKVKNKKNGDIQSWRAISCDKLEEVNEIISKISQYKENCEIYSLKIYGHLYQKEAGVIYLITEYCKKGSLLDIINYCHNKGKLLSENFIWKFLYQISLILKKTKTEDIYKINNKCIFVSNDDNFKIFIFENDKSSNNTVLEKKVILGQLILSLCTLQTTFKTQSCENLCDKILNRFSDELVELLSFIFKKQITFDEVIDTILYHPTALSKSSKSLDDNMFLDVYVNLGAQCNKKEIEDEEMKNENYINEKIKLQIEMIKNRETALKNQEQKLIEKETELKKREKKVILLEKLAAEKYTRAELYLKTSKEKRFSKTQLKRNIEENTTDVSYSADCGDNSILPTSSKLDINKFKKPVFARTCSERHVRFKGHSPLKESNYRKNYLNRCNSLINAKNVKQKSEFNSWLTLSSETNSDKSVNIEKKKKKISTLFPVLPSSYKKKNTLKENIPYRNADHLKNSSEFRPISWTEDNKKQAFDLLKMMNSINISGKDNVPVKHTDL